MDKRFYMYTPVDGDKKSSNTPVEVLSPIAAGDFRVIGSDMGAGFSRADTISIRELPLES